MSPPVVARRLLVVEDNPDWQDTYRLVAAQLNLLVDIEDSVTGAYWALASRPGAHVAAIVDLDLNKQSSGLDGVDLILAMSQRHTRAGTKPIILCRTSAGPRPRVASLFDLVSSQALLGILDKESSETSEVLKALVDVDSAYFRRHTDQFRRTLKSHDTVPRPTIEWSNPGPIVLGKSALKDSMAPEPVHLSAQAASEAITALCARAFPGYSSLGIQTLQGGYSGCLPIRVYVPDREKPKNYLLKLSRPGEAGKALLLAEAENYDRCVGAIQNSAPLLMGLFEWQSDSRGSETFFALAYELVGFFSNQELNFSSHVLARVTSGGRIRGRKVDRRTVSEELGDDLDSLFVPLAGWYRVHKAPSVDSSVRLLNDLRAHLAKAREASAPIKGTPPLDGPAKAVLPNPLDVAQQLIEHHGLLPSVTAGTIHGDLSCRNVIRRGPQKGPLSSWALIDFEDVAERQHVLMDVATLECDLKFSKRAEWIRSATDINNHVKLSALERLARLELELALDEPCPLEVARKLKPVRTQLGSGSVPWGYWVLQEQIRQLRSRVRRRFWPGAEPDHLWLEWNAALLSTSLRYLTYEHDNISLLYVWFAAAVAAFNVQHALQSSAFGPSGNYR